MLIECPQLRRVHPVNEIAGFDLSDFDIFRPPGYLQIDLNTIQHRILSDVSEVCRLDFTKDNSVQTHQTITINPKADGKCQAIAFWFDLYLDRHTRISTRVGSHNNHWKQGLQFFNSDCNINPTEPVYLEVQQTQTGIAFGLGKELSQNYSAQINSNTGFG